MLKEELEKLTCSKCEDEEFNAINVAYEELDNMTKQEFCSTLLNNSWKLVADLGKLARQNREKSEAHKHALQEVGTFVFSDDTESAKRVVKNRLGLVESIKIKLKNGVSLDDDELRYVFTII